MSVNWLWKAKKGEIIYKDTNKNQTWKLEIFGGNMMCCFIYRFLKFNEETKKNEKWYNFFHWYNDLKHARRCFKDKKEKPLESFALGNHKVVKVKLFIENEWHTTEINEWLHFAKLLTEYGYKVELSQRGTK